MEDGTSLKDEIKRLNENVASIVNKKSEKKFKIPFKGRVNNRQARNDYTTVCYVNQNGEVDFFKKKIKEGTILKDNTPHLATADYRLSYRGKPFMIIPSWSTHPFSPQKHYEETIEKKRSTAGYRLLLNALLNEQVEKKKMNLSWGTIIFLLIILGVGGYYLISKGGIF